MSFDPVSLWQTMGWVARLVVALLAIMGVASLYVGIERLVSLGKARAQSRLLGAAIDEQLRNANIAAALDACHDTTFRAAYIGRLIGSGLDELAGGVNRPNVDAAGRSMERQALQEAADLRKGMGILATVGSTAPFVGLTGTVFGIINAFEGMAETGSGGLASVSAGIAEALVTTAVGIAIAIMGVWLFNYFNARIEATATDITVAVQEFLDWCEKQLVARAQADAPTQEAVR